MILEVRGWGSFNSKCEAPRGQKKAMMNEDSESSDQQSQCCCASCRQMCPNCGWMECRGLLAPLSMFCTWGVVRLVLRELRGTRVRTRGLPNCRKWAFWDCGSVVPRVDVAERFSGREQADGETFFGERGCGLGLAWGRVTKGIGSENWRTRPAPEHPSLFGHPRNATREGKGRWTGRGA